MDINGGTHGYLNVVEVMSELRYSSGMNEEMSPLCNKLKNVTKVVNGGNFLTNREGPINLSPSEYVEVIPGGSAEIAQSKSSVYDETQTFAGALGYLFREFWASMNALFEDPYRGEDHSTVLYSFKPKQEQGEGNSDFGEINIEGFVQYYQGDYANVSYGSSNIGACGCGPTCFAMVASTILGKQVTPEDAVSWCGNTYYVWGERYFMVIFCSSKRTFSIEL